MEPFTKVKGSVVDSEGAAIANARVIYHRDLAGNLIDVTEDHGISDGTLKTDQTGSYKASIHPGIYDVCVMASAFTPQCKKVEIKPDGHAFPIFRLKVDPLVTKHLGDTFQ
jgi:hypothetical protein